MCYTDKGFYWLIELLYKNRVNLTYNLEKVSIINKDLVNNIVRVSYKDFSGCSCKK